MNSIVFATGNPFKVEEVNQMLKGQLKILSLKDIGCEDDLPETSSTLEGNALQKARFVMQRFGVDCFAEDTGLEIEALNGEPGVRSARYAGEGKDSEANMNLVLQKLGDTEQRKAQFRTKIALLLDGKEYTFQGIVRGSIRKEKSGSGGFGYDPIFEPDGFGITFAEMNDSQKNAISHRGKAIRKLIAFFKNLNT